MVKYNKEVILDLLCAAVLRRNGTAQQRCQLAVLEVKKWTEWTKINTQEKEKRKKNKNTGYFKKQCLSAKASGGIKQQPVEPWTAGG